MAKINCPVSCSTSLQPTSAQSYWARFPSCLKWIIILLALVFAETPSREEGEDEECGFYRAGGNSRRLLLEERRNVWGSTVRLSASLSVVAWGFPGNTWRLAAGIMSWVENGGVGGQDLWDLLPIGVDRDGMLEQVVCCKVGGLDLEERWSAGRLPVSLVREIFFLQQQHQQQ